MSSQGFELAILISLRDAASGGADRVSDRLRLMGKEAKVALKTCEDLRKDLKQGLVMGGVGIAGLATLRSGVKAAGDFEASMADLRMSLQEVGKDGQVNLSKLNSEMNQAESLAIRLGNALPGTTQDFIEMLAVLKQGGLDVRTILEGTGEAVAGLAIITHQQPKSLAEPFAQYVQQFELKGKETTKLADVLGKLRFATGLTPQELIEGSKFFQTRAGMPLGLTGLQGAEQSGRLLATLRSYGLEGGIGGRELGGFASGLTFHSKEQQKALAELKAKHGISLEFFDKKGQFKGFENVFAQMEKLRKLTTEQKLTFGEKLFGREGMGIASIMMKAGVQGWNDVNARIDKTAGSQEMLNQVTQTYNNKMEALLGTIDNLKATTFTPMLDMIKPYLDTANSLVGEMQEFAKEHPAIAGMTTKLFALASAALVVQGGFKAMRAAWGLWKIASAIGGGESALLSFLRKTETQAGATGVALETAGTKATGFRGKLNSIPAGIQTTIALVGVEYAISKLNEIYTEYRKLQEAREGLVGASKQGADSYSKLKEEYARQNKPLPDQLVKSEASGIFQSLNEGRYLEKRLHPEKFGWGETMSDLVTNLVTFGGASPYNFVNPNKAAEAYKQRAGSLQNPEVMRAFMEVLKSPKLGFTQQDIKNILKPAAIAFPDSYRQALEMLSKEAAQGSTELEVLKKAGLDAAESVGMKLKGAVDQADASLRNAASAAESFALKANAASGENGTPPAKAPSIKGPSKASGGTVERDGWAYVHANEDIVPARVTRAYSPRRNPALYNNAGGQSGPLHLHFHIPSNSPATQSPRALAVAVAHEVRRQRERR